MGTLFISHSTKDAELAANLRDRLATLGYRAVFLDFDPEGGIQAGASWERTLYTKLRGCRAVMAICTDNYLSSHWCFAEIALARMEGKDVFALQANPWSATTQLPAIITDRQFIDLRQNIEAGYERLWQALKRNGIVPAEHREWSPDESPFPGLRAFEESDAPIFFGREQETLEGIELLNRMRRQGHPRFALILGASGSGKSSLARAGLLPRLRKDSSRWRVVGPFRPREDPWRELALAMTNAFEETGGTKSSAEIEERLKASDASEALAALGLDLQERCRPAEPSVILFIDQFEELFGGPVESSAARKRFLGFIPQIVELENSPCVILATMRSDYLENFQKSADLKGVKFKSLSVGPMTRENMRQVIDEPARLGQVQLEKGLTELLLNDTGSSDALPLLAFTLRILWDRYSQDRLLEISEYKEIGGLQGAIAQIADETFDAALQDVDEEQLRDAFLSLTRPSDEGAAWLRQSVLFDRFPEAVSRALQRFVHQRLLLRREDGSVEVAHEALFRSWNRLKGWLDQNREFLLWRKRLEGARREWERVGKYARALLSGPALAEGSNWLDKKAAYLDATDLAFLEASVNADRENQALKEEEERKMRQLLSDTDRLRRTADLAFLGGQMIDGAESADEASCGALLVIEALAQTSNSLQAQLAWTRVLEYYPPPVCDLPIPTMRKNNAGAVGAFSADARYFALSDQAGKLSVLNLTEGTAVPAFAQEHGSAINAVAFDSLGFIFAAGGDDRHIRIWDLRDWKLITTLDLGETVQALAFVSHGRLLAAAGAATGKITTWEVGSWKLKSSIDNPTGDIMAIQFSPDGQWVAAKAWHHQIEENIIRLWDLGSGRPLLGYLKGDPYSFVLSRDGRYMAVNGSYSIHDERIRSEVRLFELGFSPAIDRINCDQVETYPLSIRNAALAFEPLSRKLAIAGGNTFRIYSTRGVREVAKIEQQNVEIASFVREGDAIGAAGGERLRIWDFGTGRKLAGQLTKANKPLSEPDYEKAIGGSLEAVKQRIGRSLTPDERARYVLPDVAPTGDKTR